MSRTKYIFIGVGGHAVAIDPTTGTEVWRSKLKSSSFVTISVAGGRVYAGASGELFCLDATTGKRLWHNKLSGLGLGVVAFASDSDIVARAAEAAAAASQAS